MRAMDSTFALSIEGRVRHYTERRLPAMVGAPCVIAASGGGDSTALTGILMHAGLLDAGRTIIAHFDHRLRTREQAAAEREAVAALARRFGVRMVEGAWERPRAGEAAAREARYHFLCDVANGVGAAAIVTGHTLDDQAETVLLRALRGAGVHGLAGMRADASAPYAGAGRVWRPLRALTREETRA